jgi:hypothetical protein
MCGSLADDIKTEIRKVGKASMQLGILSSEHARILCNPVDKSKHY